MNGEEEKGEASGRGETRHGYSSQNGVLRGGQALPTLPECRKLPELHTAAAMRSPSPLKIITRSTILSTANRLFLFDANDHATYTINRAKLNRARAGVRGF